MFSLVHPDLHEETVTPEELFARSTYTLLYFYPKDNTPWCTLEAKEFSQLIDAYTALHTQIVWVSKDLPKSHCWFIQKHWLKPLYLSDPDCLLIKKYGARGEKNTYGKKTQWVIRSSVLVDQKGAIVYHRKNVHAAGHAEEVLKKIPA